MSLCCKVRLSCLHLSLCDVLPPRTRHQVTRGVRCVSSECETTWTDESDVRVIEKCVRK